MTTNMNNKELLISGGTGSLGKTLLKILTTKYKPKGIRIFSRDELKQSILKTEYKDCEIPIAFIIGDVRDFEQVTRAFNGVDIVIHTAAMKQIDTCENNPLEAVKTNVDGAVNIIKASIINKVSKVMNVSTDKATEATTLYGATKMVAEKLFIDADVYTAGRPPHFASCRYGNVLGSRGSVIHAFKKQVETDGVLKITHPDMTRFFISLPEVAQFLINAIMAMKGGEIFIPRMKAMKITDIARYFYTDNEIEYTGLREGEKLHEILVNQFEKNNIFEYKNCFIIHRNIPVPYSSDSFSAGRATKPNLISNNPDMGQITKPEFERMIAANDL